MTTTARGWGVEGGWMGGPFPLPGESDTRRVPRPLPWDPSGVAVQTVDARSALKIVRDLVSPPRVWLPSYLCGSVLDGLSQGGTKLGFYPVDGRLQVRDRAWLDRVQRSDLVVIINYFGFSGDASLATSAADRGAYVVSDAACALMTGAVVEGDFTVFSPRKFVGVPDGGHLAARRPEAWPALKTLALDDPTASWWQDAVAACRDRPAFDRGEDSRLWFATCERAEEAPTGSYRISDLSQSLLASAFDWTRIAARRRENYGELSRRLAHLALFPDLPDRVVPFGFPVRLRQRDAVRASLRAMRVLTPVHWMLPPELPRTFADSHRLSSEMLTLPCDQRYGPDDMRRLSDLLAGAEPAL